LRSNTKGYGGKTHYADSQNSDTTAASGRELYNLQFSLQAASPETFRHNLVCCTCPHLPVNQSRSVLVFGIYLCSIPVKWPATLTEPLRGFPQHAKTKTWNRTENRQQLISSRLLPTARRSLLIAKHREPFGNNLLMALSCCEWNLVMTQ